MRKSMHALAAILLLLSWPAYAEECKTELTGSQLVLGIALTEAVVLANGYLAAADPQVYGAILTVMGPIGALTGGSSCGRRSTATRLAAAVSAAALGVYHIAALDTDEMTKSEIRKKSFIAFHAALVPVAVTALVAGDFSSSPTASVAYDPRNRTPMITFAYRY